MNPPPLRGPPPGSAAPETSPHDGKWLLESSTRTWIEYQLVCDPHGPPPTANRGGAPRLPPCCGRQSTDAFLRFKELQTASFRSVF